MDVALLLTASRATWWMQNFQIEPNSIFFRLFFYLGIRAFFLLSLYNFRFPPPFFIGETPHQRSLFESDYFTNPFVFL